MESLELDLDLFDLIEATPEKTQFPFPAVSFNTNHINSNSIYVIFNVKASQMLKDYKYMLIYGTAEFLVFCPTNTKSTKTFNIHTVRNNYCHISTTVLNRFNVRNKTFKLYKTAKGFAIKLNEPIKIREVKS